MPVHCALSGRSQIVEPRDGGGEEPSVQFVSDTVGGFLCVLHVDAFVHCVLALLGPSLIVFQGLGGSESGLTDGLRVP